MKWSYLFTHRFHHSLRIQVLAYFLSIEAKILSASAWCSESITPLCILKLIKRNYKVIKALHVYLNRHWCSLNTLYVAYLFLFCTVHATCEYYHRSNEKALTLKCSLKNIQELLLDYVDQDLKLNTIYDESITLRLAIFRNFIKIAILLYTHTNIKSQKFQI